MTIKELPKQITTFEKRDWKRFDRPKNLAISISVEASELLEYFQWKTDDQVDSMLKNKEIVSSISDELADVMIYCFSFGDIISAEIRGFAHEPIIPIGFVLGVPILFSITIETTHRLFHDLGSPPRVP